ncbi:unnamed protein product [Auanema sp. JU1783]|nr:unnamed protein product [Auanema sp. JU1783]
MKIEWQNVYRAWLAFLTLQVFGSIFVSYAGFHASQPVIFVGGEPTATSRFFALNQALLGSIRVILMGNFGNETIHLSHLITTSLFSFHFALELFCYKSLITSLYTIVLLILNVTTIIFFKLRHYLIVAEPKTEKRRSGRLIYAKHYMENDVLPHPPETAEIRKLKKRQ